MRHLLRIVVLLGLASATARAEESPPRAPAPPAVAPVWRLPPSRHAYEQVWRSGADPAESPPSRGKRGRATSRSGRGTAPRR